jgi:plastocyanin
MQSPMIRRLQPFALAAFTAIALAGCGGSDEKPGSIENVRVLDIVEGTETEYALEPPSTKLERIAFYGIEVKNDGDEPHALRIVGPGLERTVGTIEPGDSKTIAAFLKKRGTYRLTCPLDDHAAKGMRATIVVG